MKLNGIGCPYWVEWQPTYCWKPGERIGDQPGDICGSFTVGQEVMKPHIPLVGRILHFCGERSHRWRDRPDNLLAIACVCWPRQSPGRRGRYQEPFDVREHCYLDWLIPATQHAMEQARQSQLTALRLRAQRMGLATPVD